MQSSLFTVVRPVKCWHRSLFTSRTVRSVNQTNAQFDTHSNKQAGTLTGVRVLDLSRILGAPFATQQLADHGAQIIKVERPLRGDDTRHWSVTQSDRFSQSFELV